MSRIAVQSIDELAAAATVAVAKDELVPTLIGLAAVPVHVKALLIVRVVLAGKMR